MCAGINLLLSQQALTANNQRWFGLIAWFNSIALLSGLLLWYWLTVHASNQLQQKKLSLSRQLAKLERKITKPHDQPNMHHIVAINHNQAAVASVFNTINHHQQLAWQLTQLNLNLKQGTLLGTTEEIVDIAKILQDFLSAHYCLDPVVEQITRQSDRYSFSLSWRFKS